MTPGIYGVCWQHLRGLLATFTGSVGKTPRRGCQEGTRNDYQKARNDYQKTLTFFRIGFRYLLDIS